MTAPVIILPVIPRRSFGDPAWREQYERECEAATNAQVDPPPRTRPLLAVHNTQFRLIRGALVAVGGVAEQLLTRDNFEFRMSEMRDQFSDDTQRG